MHAELLQDLKCGTVAIATVLAQNLTFFITFVRCLQIFFLIRVLEFEICINNFFRHG